MMPKWGLSMQEGRLLTWHVKEGDTIEPGQELMDVETDKIANAVEATDAGLLRCRLGREDTVYPVQALLGVLAPGEVSDAEIDAYVAGFEAPASGAGKEESQAPAFVFADTPVGCLRYMQRGSGDEAVVLVHGFGGDLNNWLFNIDALAGNGRVYALDLPGHGQSVKTADSLDTLVNGLQGFMEAADVGPAHLVGHSLGGAVCALLALRQPERVKSLVLVDTAGLGAEINGAYIDGFVAARTRRELKPVVQQLFANSGLAGRQMLDELLKYKRIDGVEDALRAIAQSAFGGVKQQHSLKDRLAKAGCPVLVIWGEEDRIIPVSHATAIQRATVKILPGTGHMPQMEAAGEFNTIVGEFLRGSA